MAAHAKFYLLCQHYAQCFLMTNIPKLCRHNRHKPNSGVLQFQCFTSILPIIHILQYNKIVTIDGSGITL